MLLQGIALLFVPGPAWSVRGVAVVLVLALAYAARSIARNRRIARLGSRAPRFATRLPFGLDFIAQSLGRHRKCQSLMLWEAMLRITQNSRTVEVNVGGKDIIVTCDSQNIKAVLSTQFSSFGKGNKFRTDWREFLGSGIFNTDGEQWSTARALIRDQFKKDRLSDIEIFEKHTSRLIPMFILASGQSLDVRPLMFDYTLDIATDFLLGESKDCLGNPNNDFARAFSFIQKFHTRLLRMGAASGLMPRNELRKNLRIFNDFIDPFVQKALQFSQEELDGKPWTFLQAIAGQTRDAKFLRDQIVSVLLAGRDTTACTLTWVLYELAFAPHLVDALRKEIVRHVGLDGSPGFTELKEMRLLQHTIDETLRIYPAVPLNVREALEDTTLPRGGGLAGDEPVAILKGTTIVYSTQFMQLSDDIYPPPSEKSPDPAMFEPCRWETWRPRNHSYVPFHAGPRLCAGQQFAITEIGYTLVKILQRFSRIEPRGDLVHCNPREPSPIGSASLPVRVYECRAAMKNEVVLQPAQPITLAFLP
ncbi:putative cytochrome P450 [Septoria linicola]|nr:putative cytochrome P450 [Septoria linicola]